MPQQYMKRDAAELLVALNDVAIVEKIREAGAPFYRPALPEQQSEGVQPGVITLMNQCWAEDPAERPSFDDIIKSLKVINKGKSVFLFIFSLRL